MGLIGSLIGGTSKVQFVVNNNTVIQFDASIKENHKRKSTPTRFPVENGDVISDHIILDPFELEMTGIITDTPIGGAAQLLTEVATTAVSSLLPPAGVIAAAGAFSVFSSLSSSDSPSKAAYNQLLQLQSTATPFDVITSLYRYPSMWISDISAPRDVDTGKALIFTVSLVQLLLVSPQAVNIQIFANPGLSANQANLGQQNAGIPNGFQNGLAASTKLVGGNAN